MMGKPDTTEETAPRVLTAGQVKRLAHRAIVRTCGRCSREARRRAGLTPVCEFGGHPPARPGEPTPLICAKGLGNCGVQRLWLEAQADPATAERLAGPEGEKAAAQANDRADEPLNRPPPEKSLVLGQRDPDIFAEVVPKPLTAAELRQASAAVEEETAITGEEPPAVRVRPPKEHTTDADDEALDGPDGSDADE